MIMLDTNWYNIFNFRYCLYPQDIVLQLDQRCRLRKIQILSHQYLIGNGIILFILNYITLKQKSKFFKDSDILIIIIIVGH